MSEPSRHDVLIYTDGSCNAQYQLGAWVAIIFIAGIKNICYGEIQATTHNRMELQAVIEGIKYVAQKNGDVRQMKIISDSQYVVGLGEREARLSASNFITGKGKQLHNSDLVKELYEYSRKYELEYEKIKAHQKNDALNYNIEADKLSRKLVRAAVKRLI